MRSRLAASVAAAVALSGLVVPAFASTAAAAGAEPPAGRGSDSVRAELDRYRPTGRLQVRFKPGADAGRRSAALARVAARGHSVAVARRIDALNAAVLAVSDSRAVRAQLRQDPDVLYVEPESRYQAMAEPVSPDLTEIGAAAVHAQPSPNLGAGAEIAILDSPVSSTIADLNGPGKVVLAPFATTDVPDDPTDDWQDFACDALNCPHGTAVATAAAAEADDTGMVGVAPGATIRSYDVFRRWVYTDPDTATQYHEVSATSGDIAGALAAVATYAAANPQLVAVNMSLGGPFDSQLIRDAIANLHATAPRVTVVVAAGNDGAERANFPAGDPYVLSVGATGQVTTGSCAVTPDPSTPWTVASFSNRGKVDVVAPGHCVLVWEPPVNPQTGAVTGPAALTKSSGTSYAAPMVAGVAALLATAPAPVVGDAARAAIIASATGAPSVNVGVGKANAAAALDVADGPGVYTAMTLDRGGQVASAVGKRAVEVIRVDPSGATTPTVPVPAVTAGFGAIAAGTTQTAAGISRRYATFASAATSGTFSLTAAGGAGGDDTVVVPMKMLDAADNFEGLPAAHNEAAAVPLTYGSRSAYIRSAAIGANGTLDWDFTYGEGVNDPNLPPSSDIFFWEPSTAGGVADAAMEPMWGGDPNGLGTSGIQAGASECKDPDADPMLDASWHLCRTGRYLVGFLTFSPEDNSSATSRYALRLRYTGPTVTLASPALASASGATGPFAVSWGGTRAVKWDVSYAVKTKVGGVWKISAWKPWKTGTTAKSAKFGGGNLPEKIGQGRTYWIRAIGYDSLGNPTLPRTAVTSAPFDDRYSGVAYSTGATAWAAFGSSSYWLGTGKKSSAAGARASMASETSAFSIIGTKCAGCGQFKVYVDGVLKKTVDTYRSTTAVRQVLWSSGTIAGGIKPHRVTVIVVGTRGRPAVVLDGISILR